MPTQSEIARDWQTSREYVRQCVKKGCPLDSFENARLWRLANASKRAPTSPAQIAKQLAKERDDESPEARDRRKEYFEDKPEGTNIPTETGLDDGLFQAQQASGEAYRLLSEAMALKEDSKISTRLAVFNKASENLFKAEQAHREELERRQIIIPLALAQDMARKGFDVIIAALAALPQNLCARVNPVDPLRAANLLESECTRIMERANKAFMALPC